MQLFFQENIERPLTYLDEEESKHLIRVLRKKQGDSIRLTNGKGQVFEGVVSEANPKRAVLNILSVEDVPEDGFYIHLAIAPTKSPDRMEWMVEKISEIGFHELTLLETINSERSFLKTDRLQKKMISACKQSLKYRTPTIKATTKLSELFNAGEFDDYQKFIAYVDEDHENHLFDVALPNKRYLILVGPEGDFDAKEIQTALDNGFVPISLGKSRLRTETAGLTAVQILQVINR
ncbi:16S rRNA (uracil(1498)-N(3))-methyltransferase [Algoriphagus aestuariicola]|uniref:Ribosomal RNA small subunit methyltransferase E n=1 Tax=Algoriphagus aestuariicola TaxID=1852016 RepID=A0ABS3BPB3_9BACT|nr:16S rRNA (uracil(1498)-N(3))-methyltransferase [Algoriphagus aestuariicola]MBN7800993.1 16S rRNA (uracil(1498)-N(3))-methyltransferase [Algoriphagus aestuariicola]